MYDKTHVVQCFAMMKAQPNTNVTLSIMSRVPKHFPAAGKYLGT